MKTQLRKTKINENPNLKINKKKRAKKYSLRWNHQNSQIAAAAAASVRRRREQR